MGISCDEEAVKQNTHLYKRLQKCRKLFHLSHSILLKMA
uniref:Uncharacterized protein n=1 Tax=Faecalibaculum rodentium TaxID=1702221 RepID=A0A140DT67_9FIRM|nr:hypothetical protein AALO17_07100 [Faecalibaculum rodentium]